ncbi:patatin-like phospholipase family protein [Halomonas sp. PGE1]|uniref:patatin-like phospholipase family protein n=1 Tax=Halomonas sp. PGE1 TaxID=2730360 RepID=UPI00147307B6|nr:patatin-like phospholipase family protein [Halomonas sp. PGE1]QJQ98100.1 patatin-like phospholipase family protein [Halomonas sp. PGE1]
MRRSTTPRHPRAIIARLARLAGIWLLLGGLFVGQAGAAAPERPTLGLALGSGGANGLAHIAMLRVLDELEIVPDRIAGTSIGAVIGGLYAAGLSADQIQDIFDDVAGSPLDALSGLAGSELDLADLLQLGLSDGGLFDSGGFLRYLAAHTEARTFDDLAIPLSVVATDYWSGDSVVIEAGRLFPAIEASMAVPGLFSPVRRDELLLIDGGTSNPLPFELLLDEMDLVIAVDVSGARHPDSDPVPGITDLLFKTFSIMQQSLIRQALAHRRPHLYLKPEAAGVRLLHFNRIHEILAQAEPVADELRDQLTIWLAIQADAAMP